MEWFGGADYDVKGHEHGVHRTDPSNGGLTGDAAKLDECLAFGLANFGFFVG